VARNFLQRDYLTNKAGRIVLSRSLRRVRRAAFRGAAGDRELLQKLAGRYSVILTPEGQKLVSTNRHVDFRVWGIVPLEIYLETGDERYLNLGRDLADQQWEDPLPDGLTHETRWWWMMRS